jgi:hypothetical protein
VRKIIIKLILALNAFIWIVLSMINYVGIMIQLKEGIMKIFLWSIITVTMYGVVIYAITLVITRIFQIYHYKDIKIKYINMKAFRREIFLLTGVILYLYGACYYNSIFIGLLPMLIFFSKSLTNLGRFYIYENGRLLMIDGVSNQYQVKGFSQQDNKVIIQEVNTRSLDLKETVFDIDSGESKFLMGFFIKEATEMEVA